MITPTKETATLLVQTLQTEPAYYRNFGPYWWIVKRWLKRLGFTRANIPHLGAYADPLAATWYNDRPFLEAVAEAFEFQAERAQDCPGSPFCQTPEGEDYILEDQDAE